MSILRDLALMLLALEIALGALAGVALMTLLNYGLYRSRWWRVLPRWLQRARRVLGRGQKGVEQVCRQMVRPVLALSSLCAAFSGMLRPGREHPDARGSRYRYW
ncbi:MAG: hypothetical protein RML46_07625 [Anaerolineae bacterium]|nr:hypothetical protein [Anaerolineae bacterium]MDW8068766.1 hypothetical protein [Anaerolineae bacterium]